MWRSTTCSKSGAPLRGPDPQRRNRGSQAPPLREEGGAAAEGGAEGGGAEAPAPTAHMGPTEVKA